MTLHEILQAKGSEVHQIAPSASLDEVVQELVRNNVGSFMGCGTRARPEERQIMGIITERDILRVQAAHRAPFDKLRVEDVMSKDLVTASPDDSVEWAMGLMT